MFTSHTTIIRLLVYNRNFESNEKHHCKNPHQEKCHHEEAYLSIQQI